MSILKVTLERLKLQKILVLGDLMLDAYWWGSADRISPEAPVPVLQLKTESVRLGGAANVALNLVGLGCSVGICGLVGDDSEAATTLELLQSAGITPEGVLSDPARPTTVKRRILANNQQLLRVDRESTERLTSVVEQELLEDISASIADYDCVVISDYAKGFVSENLVKVAVLSDKPVFADPKGADYSKYSGTMLLTPNLKEFHAACLHHDIHGTSLENSALSLIKKIGVENILVTRGSEGMTLVRGDGTVLHREATARKVYDVTGAGDTVIATFAAAISSGADYPTAVELANEAAGLVVESVGTTAISSEILSERMRDGR